MAEVTYLHAYTQDRTRTEAQSSLHVPAVGAQAPAFSLPDTLGRTVALTDLYARGPVIVTFYRGEWCPYCNLQLRAYQQALPEITAAGAALVAISPQTPDHSLSMQEKNDLAFTVLSDIGNVIARQYGLVYTVDTETRDAMQNRFGVDLAQYNGNDSWELPMPGTFVIGQDGAIRLAFVETDYTKRLDPADIIDALRGAAIAH